MAQGVPGDGRRKMTVSDMVALFNGAVKSVADGHQFTEASDAPKPAAADGEAVLPPVDSGDVGEREFRQNEPVVNREKIVELIKEICINNKLVSDHNHILSGFYKTLCYFFSSDEGSDLDALLSKIDNYIATNNNCEIIKDFILYGIGFIKEETLETGEGERRDVGSLWEEKIPIAEFRIDGKEIGNCSVSYVQAFLYAHLHWLSGVTELFRICTNVDKSEVLNKMITKKILQNTIEELKELTKDQNCKNIQYYYNYLNSAPGCLDNVMLKDLNSDRDDLLNFNIGLCVNSTDTECGIKKEVLEGDSGIQNAEENPVTLRKFLEGCAARIVNENKKTEDKINNILNRTPVMKCFKKIITALVQRSTGKGITVKKIIGVLMRCDKDFKAFLEIFTKKHAENWFNCLELGDEHDRDFWLDAIDALRLQIKEVNETSAETEAAFSVSEKELSGQVKTKDEVIAFLNQENMKMYKEWILEIINIYYCSGVEVDLKDVIYIIILRDKTALRYLNIFNKLNNDEKCTVFPELGGKYNELKLHTAFEKLKVDIEAVIQLQVQKKKLAQQLAEVSSVSDEEYLTESESESESESETRQVEKTAALPAGMDTDEPQRRKITRSPDVEQEKELEVKMGQFLAEVIKTVKNEYAEDPKNVTRNAATEQKTAVENIRNWIKNFCEERGIRPEVMQAFIQTQFRGKKFGELRLEKDFQKDLILGACKSLT